MNDVEVASLVLGIIGTVTGIVALSLHYWKLKRETPRLKTEILKCEHDFEEEKKTLSFWANLQIRNLGDRGTDILRIALTFEEDEQKHNLKLESQSPVIEYARTRAMDSSSRNNQKISDNFHHIRR